MNQVPSSLLTAFSAFLSQADNAFLSCCARFLRDFPLSTECVLVVTSSYFDAENSGYRLYSAVKNTYPRFGVLRSVRFHSFIPQLRFKDVLKICADERIRSCDFSMLTSCAKKITPENLSLVYNKSSENGCVALLCCYFNLARKRSTPMKQVLAETVSIFPLLPKTLIGDREDDDYKNFMAQVLFDYGRGWNVGQQIQGLKKYLAKKLRLTAGSLLEKTLGREATCQTLREQERKETFYYPDDSGNYLILTWPFTCFEDTSKFAKLPHNLGILPSIDNLDHLLFDETLLCAKESLNLATKFSLPFDKSLPCLKTPFFRNILRGAKQPEVDNQGNIFISDPFCFFYNPKFLPNEMLQATGIREEETVYLSIENMEFKSSFTHQIACVSNPSRGNLFSEPWSITCKILPSALGNCGCNVRGHCHSDEGGVLFEVFYKGQQFWRSMTSQQSCVTVCFGSGLELFDQEQAAKVVSKKRKL